MAYRALLDSVEDVMDTYFERCRCVVLQLLLAACGAVCSLRVVLARAETAPAATRLLRAAEALRQAEIEAAVVLQSSMRGKLQRAYLRCLECVTGGGAAKQ
jgi:hypothetical protein